MFDNLKQFKYKIVRRTKLLLIACSTDTKQLFCVSNVLGPSSGSMHTVGSG